MCVKGYAFGTNESALPKQLFKCLLEYEDKRVLHQSNDAEGCTT